MKSLPPAISRYAIVSVTSECTVASSSIATRLRLPGFETTYQHYPDRRSVSALHSLYILLLHSSSLPLLNHFQLTQIHYSLFSHYYVQRIVPPLLESFAAIKRICIARPPCRYDWVTQYQCGSCSWSSREFKLLVSWNVTPVSLLFTTVTSDITCSST